MHEIIKEVVVCVIYVFLVLLLAYTNRDPRSYSLNLTYDNIFNKGEFDRAVLGERQAFDSVSSFMKYRYIHKEAKHRTTVALLLVVLYNFNFGCPVAAFRFAIFGLSEIPFGRFVPSAPMSLSS